METRTFLSRKKIAAFGVGFFGMFWLGGTCALALYDLVHRMIYGRFPVLNLDVFFGQGAYVFAHTPGEDALLRFVTARLLETDVIVAVMTVPLLGMLACMALYGWKALAGDFAGLRSQRDENGKDGVERKGRNAAFQTQKPAGRALLPQYGRPVRSPLPGPGKADDRAA